MTTKLSLEQATRLLDSMDYYLTDASVWTPEAIIEEAEALLEVATTDADFEYQIIDDGDGPIAIFNGIPGEVLDALNEDGYYIVNVTEVKAIETNNTTKTGNDEPAKEAIMIPATIKAAEIMISDAATFTKTSDSKYVDKKCLGTMIQALGGVLQVKYKLNNRMSRPELITELKRLVDEHSVSKEHQGQVVKKEVVDEIKPISVIDDVWNVANATKVLKKIIEMAQDNDYISFISHHMATSAITEVLFGKKLVDPITKVANKFTDGENRLAAEFRTKFAEQYLIANKKGTGYNINSLAMSWHYKKCIYRWKSDSGEKVVDYIVDYNTKTLKKYGVANAQDNKLDDAAFKKLDATCKFVKVAK